MLDQQHRESILLQLADARVELVNLLGVHSRGRLVEQQQGRLCNDGAGEFEAALFAEREITREFVALARQIGKLEDPVNFLARAARTAEPAAQKAFAAVFDRVLRHPQILPDAELAEQPDVLKCAGNPARHPHMRGKGGDVLVAQQDLAGRDRKQAADEIDDRRLAGAVRPDQAEHLALRNPEIEAVDGADAAEMFTQPLEFEHCPAPCCEFASV
jgi:hypothetical protein